MEGHLDPSRQRGRGAEKLGLTEFLALPDDGKRYEILNGELYVSPSPIPRHQKIAMRLGVRLFTALEETGRGSVLAAPCDVVLGKHDIVEPDLIFVSTARLGIIGEKRLKGAPDLLVEILSRRTQIRDRKIKARRYARAGVPVYWIVDPMESCLEVYKPVTGRAYSQVSVTRSPHPYVTDDFGGLEIDLKSLFAP
jgi:Uma2 family endonuclease